ncbi:MAG: hypothetical protein P2A85_26555 [Microcoleus anatoxicus]
MIIKRAIALLNYLEKGRSLFFDRRWTQINSDVRRAIDRLMNYGRSAF